jgi:hypothetical protein
LRDFVRCDRVVADMSGDDVGGEGEKIRVSHSFVHFLEMTVG